MKQKRRTESEEMKYEDLGTNLGAILERFSIDSRSILNFILQLLVMHAELCRILMPRSKSLISSIWLILDGCSHIFRVRAINNNVLNLANIGLCWRSYVRSAVGFWPSFFNNSWFMLDRVESWCLGARARSPLRKTLPHGTVAAV